MSPSAPDIDHDHMTDAAERLRGRPPHEIAEALTRSGGSERAVTFRLLPKEDAIGAFGLLDAPVQQALVDDLGSDEALGLIEQLQPDDRVQLLDEMPALVVQRVLAQLTPAERERTAELIGYPPRSAGRRMSPSVARVGVGDLVGAALDRVRSVADEVETLDVVAVTDRKHLLVGALRLSDLLIAPDEQPVSAVMNSRWPTVSAYQDDESAARLLQETDLFALPVVDAEGRLVGILTADDAMEVLEAADTEDFSQANAVQPLRRPYLTASIPFLARRRIVWLLLLIVAASLTVQVLGTFESTLEQVVTLALFIPLLIGTGGNAGAQAATTVVRAMAVGEIRPHDAPRVIAREFATGTVLGLMLAVLAFGPVALLFDPRLAAVVTITLVMICSWASTVGSAMPMLARRIGIDPALVSAPLVTTLVDATGLVAYFVVAEAILL